jgi:hypothetical protein
MKNTTIFDFRDKTENEIRTLSQKINYFLHEKGHEANINLVKGMLFCTVECKSVKVLLKLIQELREEYERIKNLQ